MEPRAAGGWFYRKFWEFYGVISMVYKIVTINNCGRFVFLITPKLHRRIRGKARPFESLLDRFILREAEESVKNFVANNPMTFHDDIISLLGKSRQFLKFFESNVVLHCVTGQSFLMAYAIIEHISRAMSAREFFPLS